MRRRTAHARRRQVTYRFDWRRWLTNAPLRQFLLVVFVGIPLVFIGFSVLLPYLLAAGIVLAFVAGLVFMKIGGPVISVVSILDRQSEYDAPPWFPYVKWGTAPVRLLDNSISLYDGLVGRNKF